MIKEDLIEGIIEKINQDVDLAIVDFVKNEKAFSSYLLGEDFHLLSEEEKELLLFVHVVLFQSTQHLESAFDPEAFQTIEEKNWIIIDDKSLSWDQKVDSIFNGYTEEDLLAFTEDMLSEEVVSQLARELIFITAKSYIDLKTNL